MRRAGCLVLGVVLLALIGLSSLVGQVFGGGGPGGAPAGPWRGLVPLAVIAVVVGAAVSVRAARRLAGPLDDLLQAARRVEAGDYTVRVTPGQRGPAELRDLLAAFNTMTARLQADEQSRRSLLADVTHELRTPLAVVRGEVEAILDGVHPADPPHLTAVLDEVQVLTQLVEDLRTLALSEGGTLALHREAVDVGQLLADVAVAFRGAADRAGVTLEVEEPHDLPVLELDPVRMREVLENLTANAVRHTPSGGRVVLAARADTQAVTLTVADTGSGIPPELLPHVFDRFVKGSASTGSGLGLAIARHLVEAHGGQITAHSEPGRGTRMVVRLPRQ